MFFQWIQSPSDWFEVPRQVEATEALSLEAKPVSFVLPTAFVQSAFLEAEVSSFLSFLTFFHMFLLFAFHWNHWILYMFDTSCAVRVYTFKLLSSFCWSSHLQCVFPSSLNMFEWVFAYFSGVWVGIYVLSPVSVYFHMFCLSDPCMFPSIATCLAKFLIGSTSPSYEHPVASIMLNLRLHSWEPECNLNFSSASDLALNPVKDLCLNLFLV